MTKSAMVKKIQLAHCNGRAMNLKTLLLTLSLIGTVIKMMYIEDEHLVFVGPPEQGSDGELRDGDEGAWNLNKLNLIDQDQEDIYFFYAHLMPSENE